MRAYELMIIFRGDLDSQAVSASLHRATTALVALGAGDLHVDNWGKRRFAYEIDHRSEGYYAVVDFTADGIDLPGFERSLRIADDVVRHKLIRLPAAEAERRATERAKAGSASGSA